jgi:hypothetical protein
VEPREAWCVTAVLIYISVLAALVLGSVVDDIARLLQ